MQTAELLPDCVRFSCCSPLASASAAYSPLASASAAALGPDCGIHFNCCSPLPPLLLPDCVCCSPLASASAAAPDRVHFGCYMYSPIASASTAAARLRPLQLLLPDCVCWIPAHEHSSRSSRLSKVRRSCVTIVQSRPTNIPLPLHTHTQTDKHTLKS